MCSFESLPWQYRPRKQLKRKKPLNKVSKSKHRRANRVCPKKVANEVIERSGGICEFVDTEGLRWQKDRKCNREATCFQHRKKKSQGGKYTLDNLRHSCWLCNMWAETSEGKVNAPKLGWTIL